MPNTPENEEKILRAIQIDCNEISHALSFLNSEGMSQRKKELIQNKIVLTINKVFTSAIQGALVDRALLEAPQDWFESDFAKKNIDEWRKSGCLDLALAALEPSLYETVTKHLESLSSNKRNSSLFFSNSSPSSSSSPEQNTEIKNDYPFSEEELMRFFLSHKDLKKNQRKEIIHGTTISRDVNGNLVIVTQSGYSCRLKAKSNEMIFVRDAVFSSNVDEFFEDLRKKETPNQKGLLEA